MYVRRLKLVFAKSASALLMIFLLASREIYSLKLLPRPMKKIHPLFRRLSLVLKAAAYLTMWSCVMGTLMALVANSMLLVKDMSQIPEMSLSIGRSTLEIL